MKKTFLLLIFGVLLCSNSFSQQYFNDNFDSYTLNSFVAVSSPQWTTWTNSPGSAEDARVVNTKSSSGAQSIYFESALGNGPQDLVLDFGKVHTKGRFKFTTKLFVPTGKAAYFNFQAGATTGITWALEFYMRAGGTYDMTVGSLTGTYPQNRWFEVVFDMDLDNGVWEFFIDGVSRGTINNSNSVSFLDVFPADANSEFWMDDVSFCVDNACNAELSMESLSISPNSICQEDVADVTVKVKNNSDFSANEMTLELEVGPDKISQLINLNNLAGGRDTTFTVKNMFKSSISGSGISVSAINKQSDVKPSNDTAKTTVTVNPAPKGAALVQGTPYTSPNLSTNGLLTDPDIVAPKDVLTYELTTPTGFSNSSYGTNWEISGITLMSKGGASISSSYYSFTAASGSANAKFSINPDSLICDTTLILTFRVVDKSNSCGTTITRVIYVAPKPVATFNVANVCDKEDLFFSNTSSLKIGVMTNTWDFGDGTSSTLTDPIKRYATAGTYDVKLIVSSPHGYKDSVTKKVEVFPIPQANFGFTNACEGTAISFRDQSIFPTGGTTVYNWNFGSSPPSSSSAANPTKLYNAPGIYTVELKVTVNGCSASITKNVTQEPRSKPDFTFTNSGCDNLLIPFTNATTAPAFGTTGYTWKFGDGTQASQVSPKHNYNVFNTFNVTLISTTDLGCADSITKPVTLIESPKPVFTSAGQRCTNGVISFNNSTNIPVGSTNTYEWDFGDGNSSTDATPDNVYVSPGNYKVVLKAISTNGCDGETEVALTINEKPVSEFVANNVCEGEETKFSNGSTITNGTLTYTWDLDDGNPTTSVTNPSTTYVGAKTYNVSLVSASANGCNDTITKAVEVFEVPTATVAIASNLTQDGTMLFSTTTTGTGYTYFWTFGDGGNSSQQNPTYKYNFPGTWPVKLCVKTPNGCEDCLSTSVFVNPLSVNDLTNTQWTIYPNPSTGKFFIKYEGAEIAKVAISDILGKTITEQIPTNGSSELAIDLSNQKAGVYVITLTDENGNRSTQKVTITQ